MRELSAAFDEPPHLASGYAYLKTGQFQLNSQHPPLIKLLCAAPLLLVAPRFDIDEQAWNPEQTDEWALGYRFLCTNDADRLLWLGRLPVALLSLLLGFYVYRWARELFGELAGLVALTLCAFSPTVIAHARLVTFDVPLAAFSTLALYHLWRHARSGSWAHLTMAGLGLGLALASKFSAAILILAFVILLAWARLRPPRGSGSYSLLASLLVTVALAALVVQATYFFSSDLLVWWKGLAQVNADHDPTYPYYLMGRFQPGGWWYYFLAAFVIKTPIPTLILLALSIVFARRFAAQLPLDEAFLLIPILLYVVATSAMADNMGIRYLLPIYPLLFVFVSRLARALPGRTAVRLVAAALALWYAGGTLLIFPDHLAYFNELVGGPRRGHLWLDDSNIDWGTDLKRLKRWMDRHGIERIKLHYAPQSCPEYYGIRADPVTESEWGGTPPPGVYAMGTHLLIRGEYYARQRGVKTDWLSRYKPIGRVGYSIYIFRF